MKRALSIILAVVMMAAMSVSVFAENFVGSIEAKPAPEIKGYVVDGKEYSVLFTDPATGEITGGIPASDDGSNARFKLVSVADNSSTETQSEMLKEAYANIKTVKSVKYLSANVSASIDTIIKEFNSNNNQNLTDEDLIISDVFEAGLGEGITIPEGKKCTFAVKPAFTKNDCFAVLFKAADGEWCVLNDVKWTDDGYLEITTDKVGVFAFATEKNADLPVDPHGPDSPQTNNKDCYKFLYAGIAVLCVGASVFFFVKAKKRRKAQ